MQVLIPEGTVGYVQENFLGSMVQWRVQIDGWEIINQQLQVKKQTTFEKKLSIV